MPVGELVRLADEAVTAVKKQPSGNQRSGNQRSGK